MSEEKIERERSEVRWGTTRTQVVRITKPDLTRTEPPHGDVPIVKRVEKERGKRKGHCRRNAKDSVSVGNGTVNIIKGSRVNPSERQSKRWTGQVTKCRSTSELRKLRGYK